LNPQQEAAVAAGKIIIVDEPELEFKDLIDDVWQGAGHLGRVQKIQVVILLTKESCVACPTILSTGHHLTIYIQTTTTTTGISFFGGVVAIDDC